MTDAKQRQPKPVEAMKIAPRTGSSYPTAFRGVVGTREKRALGAACGLTHYGVNLVHLPPGAWSERTVAAAEGWYKAVDRVGLNRPFAALHGWWQGGGSEPQPSPSRSPERSARAYSSSASG